MGNNATVEIHGQVAPGFESVKKLFEHNMRTRAERDAQLCVYVGEERVVDLWASVGNPSFNADTLVNVFSSGKSLEAIAIAHLVGSGQMQYEDKVVAHWPEFGAMGKDKLTIADVMRHEAGLAAFQVSLDPADLLTDNIKQNRVGAVIENHAQRYRKGDGTQREYHAVTRGWIVNEIFRRVDPQRRTIGEFVREHLREPLGADILVGVPEAELGRRVDVVPLGAGYHLKETLKPRALGRKVTHNIFQLCGRLARLISSVRQSSARSAPPAFIGMDAVDDFNRREIIMGETSSANAHCSARGLARAAAAMACGGSLASTEVVNEVGWQALHAEPIKRDMGMVTTFTQGGVACFPERSTSIIERAMNRGREGYYGWMGLGGSLFQWHPQKKIGFAFVPTSLHVLDFVNERGKAYQREIRDLVR